MSLEIEKGNFQVGLKRGFIVFRLEAICLEDLIKRTASENVLELVLEELQGLHISDDTEGCPAFSSGFASIITPVALMCLESVKDNPALIKVLQVAEDDEQCLLLGTFANYPKPLKDLLAKRKRKSDVFFPSEVSAVI